MYSTINLLLEEAQKIMSNYQEAVKNAELSVAKYGEHFKAVNPESVARMRLQNRFHSGLLVINVYPAIGLRGFTPISAQWLERHDTGITRRKATQNSGVKFVLACQNTRGQTL